MYEKKFDMLAKSKYKNAYEALAYEHKIVCPYCGADVMHDVTKEDDLSFKVVCPQCHAKIDIVKPMEYAMGLKKIEEKKEVKIEKEHKAKRKFGFAKKEKK